LRLETALRNGKVKIKKPTDLFVKKVNKYSESLGDAFFLSKADVQILALALELKNMNFSPLIATDDYSVQNVANMMNIEFASLLTFGIKFRVHWVRYCPACKRKYPPNYKLNTCAICGTKLKRKPYRKATLNKHK
jgi:UPF0271 protein